MSNVKIGELYCSPYLVSANTTLRLAVTWYVPYECGDSSNELTLTEVEVRLYCTVLFSNVL